jgi:hypothetical protein
MNELQIGKFPNFDFSKFQNSGFLFLADRDLPHIPRARVYDPRVSSFNPLKNIDATRARELAVVLYSAYPQGESTLTVRNGAIDLAPALLEAGRFDKLQSDSEEVMRLKDDILFSPTIRHALCEPMRPFSFDTNSVVIADLRRSVLGDYDARIIGLLLMSFYQGQLIVPNLGFFGRDIHTRLIAEERLIAGVRKLNDLKRKAPELREEVLTIECRIPRGAIYPDAKELALLEGLRPDPLRADNSYNKYIEAAMSAVLD